MNLADKTDRVVATCKVVGAEGSSIWCERYAEKHRLKRVSELPAGIGLPRRVRVYERREHHILQWWDKQEKRTLNERIDGDLIAAISRAREIDERLDHFKSSGRKTARFGHSVLIDKYVADLQQRANAGEIDIATVKRYSSALQRHYQPFVEQPSVSRIYRNVVSIDREFQLEFAAFLANARVSPNGHPSARFRPLKQPTFIMNTVRAMLQWAADPNRGNLLPESFRNPFAQRSRDTRQVAPDLSRELDISMSMAVDLIHVCDWFQLAVFAPLALYGLRPGELGWLFREHIEDDWLRVPCIPELDYLTKGRRNKAFPVLPCLQSLWRCDSAVSQGLLYINRRLDSHQIKPPLVGKSVSELVNEYSHRCGGNDNPNAEHRRKVRDRLMKEAGQLNYDHVASEFRSLSRWLDWPAEATLKDLRHLFATSLENAGVPEHYKRFFMGQSPGRAPIIAYTHLNEIHQRFHDAVEKTLHPLVDAIERRSQDLASVRRSLPEESLS